MEAAGIHVARSSLTYLVHRTAELLEPVYESLLGSILSGDVVTMDETPIRAGRKKGRGRMKTGYFWPVYGDRDEIAFPFAPSRSGEVVRKILGEFKGKLLTDGYTPYEKYAARIEGMVHAQCWSHARRKFVEAEQADPALAGEALERIAGLYEADARATRAGPDEKTLRRRAELCKPIVDAFFSWLREVLDDRALLPRNPFTEAAGYVLAREGSLRVFLEYPGVPLDTNHLERQIRPVAVGRKHWLFCWTEVGASYAGILQSLIQTCRLHGVDPYVYLVDVLQRVSECPAKEVATLTPRLWKEHFGSSPLRSPIDPASQERR